MRRSKRKEDTDDQISADLLQMSKDVRDSIRKVNRYSRQEDTKTRRNEDEHFAIRGISLDRARKFKLAEEYGIEEKRKKKDRYNVSPPTPTKNLQDLGKKVDETQNRLRSLFSRGQFQGLKVRPLLRSFQELEDVKAGMVSIDDFRDVLKARLDLPLSRTETDVLCEWFETDGFVKYMEFVLWCEPWTSWGTTNREKKENKNYTSKKSRLRGTYTNRFAASTGLSCIHEIVRTRSDELRKRRRERKKMSRMEDATDVLKRLGMCFHGESESLDGFLERSSIRDLKKRVDIIYERHGLMMTDSSSSYYRSTGTNVSTSKKRILQDQDASQHLMDSEELLDFLNEIHDAILLVLHETFADNEKDDLNRGEIIGNRLVRYFLSFSASSSVSL
jgi:Ca2+-binding EF-hand superfamily protein